MCTRASSGVHAEHLRYHQLNNFDRELNHLDSVYHFSSHPHQVVSEASDHSKLLVCERGPLLFVFNFHPEADYTDLKVLPPCPLDATVHSCAYMPLETRCTASSRNVRFSA